LVNRVRENELPFNPLVEVALTAVAEWVSIYRDTIGSLHDEFGLCEPDEVMRMAKEIGLTPSQLHELANEGPGTANLLKNMLVALHVDPKVLADTDPFIRRELQWLCLTCSNKKRCEHELAAGTATDHFREFCPNAVSIDELFE
jgi:hypothetical protein